MNLDSEPDKISMGSHVTNYDNKEQECNNMLGENKMVVMVSVLIAEDKSFISSPHLENTDP